MSTEKLKREIVKKYGNDFSVDYYYYSYNPIKYMGEKQVRKSFDSVKKYGKNVYIGDYSSTDGIKELVEEYGFTYLKVEKTPNIFFHESKIANKIIKETKSSWLCYLNYWTTYPEGFQNIIINWLKKNNGSVKHLKMTGFTMSKAGKKVKSSGITHAVSFVIYRPFLLEARGFDERTSYHAGTRNYAHGVLQRIYKLQITELKNVNFTHALHTNNHYDKVTMEQKKHGLKIAEDMTNYLAKDLYKRRKKVKNSYW